MKEIRWDIRLDPGQEQGTSPFEHGNKHMGSTKRGEFLELIQNLLDFQIQTAPRNWLDAFVRILRHIFNKSFDFSSGS